jgi:cardiolipin synthase
MDVWKLLHQFWHYGVATLTLIISLVASAHALLYKRDSRAAVLWVGLVWLVPLVGGVLYFIFGINRIRRRALELRGASRRYRTSRPPAPAESEYVENSLPPEAWHLAPLARVVNSVVRRPLLPGNRVETLVNGDAAYPAMLDAIANAKESITLSTYIFDRDEAGLAFAKALGDATRRGVEARVLIDATGTRYSWPSILRVLRRERIRYARFLPAFPLWRLMSMNLRSHRKILVVDGRVGFTGGMNIRVGHWLKHQPRRPVQDLHFRVEGPVVAQLQEIFSDDWLFASGESLRGAPWFVDHESRGPVLARAIADGPDDDVDPLRWSILGALTAAKKSVRIVTPYFLPDPPLIAALNLTAMRGVPVDIVLPSRCNLPFVHWASRAQWWQVLERGCRIWVTPPPFDHSKVMLVDGCWVFVGSANWDPRSLRLNFEFNLECYDRDLASALGAIVDGKLKQACRVTLADVDARSFPGKLRDGTARLLTPYL